MPWVAKNTGGDKSRARSEPLKHSVNLTYLQDVQASLLLDQQAQSVSDIKKVRDLKQIKTSGIKLSVESQTSPSSFFRYPAGCLYLLFAELADRQDVLAHQQVQQRRGLEVGHLHSSRWSLS